MRMVRVCPRLAEAIWTDMLVECVNVSSSFITESLLDAELQSLNLVVSEAMRDNRKLCAAFHLD
jgi:hypothetical protein